MVIAFCLPDTGYYLNKEICETGFEKGVRIIHRTQYIISVFPIQVNEKDLEGSKTLKSQIQEHGWN